MGLKFSLDQPHFSAGELAPSLWGRVDLAKYRAGARAMRNFFALATGGASNRPGTIFIGRCKTQNISTPPVLIPFSFSTLQTYMLEFGDHYMRVIAGIGGAPSGYVLEPSKAISGITQANPGVITATAHGFANGDWVQINGVLGMTQINSFQGAQPYAFIVQNVTANTFTLTDLDGNAINTTNFSAYTSGGTVARIFTLTTPYAVADVQTLKWTQKFDVMTLVHPNYAPYQLTRTQHWIWTITAITYAATVQPPTTQSATALNNPTGNPQYTYVYAVTALTDSPFEESVPVVTAGIQNAALNQTTGVANQITWSVPAGGPGPNRYNIYKAVAVPSSGTASSAPVFGYIGQSTVSPFQDNNILADFSRTPPTHQNPFASSNNPSASPAYYQGRLFYGATVNVPTGLNASKTGDYSNMDFASPTLPNDAFSVNLESNQVNAIKHLIAMNSLIALTSSGAWQISGGGGPGSPIEPSTITAQPQAYIGCSDVRPITINYDILYVQAKQSRVRDLSYNFYVNLYTGDDKSILSEHMILGRQILRWAFAEEPFKVIWAVRDDGVCLGFTFLKEQDVYAWSRHDTNGLFQSVGTVTEGQEDAVYFIVSRIIPGVNGGNPVSYVERMHTRFLGGDLPLNIQSQVELAWFVDSGLGYGPNVITTANLFPGVGACNGGQTGVTFFADQAGTFTSGMVGNVIRANGGIATITGFTDGQHVVCSIAPWAPFASMPNDPNMPTLNPLNGVQIPPITGNAALAQPMPAKSGTWSNTTPVTSVSGLAHLNGATVGILADGSVLTPQVVANGAVTLPQAASIVAIGLPYTAQLLTMSLEIEPTVQGKRKVIPEVTLVLQDTRGLKIQAQKDERDTANIPPLIEIKERTSQNFGQAVPLVTGYEHVHPMPQWSRQGSILLQQDQPLPTTILAIVPRVVVGSDDG